MTSDQASRLKGEGRFTPGPWSWWTSNSWRRLYRDDHGIRQVVIEPFVARDGHPDLTVSEGDMALIAAAPEMYEALSKVRQWLLTVPSAGTEGVTWLLGVTTNAIAKAEGRSC